MTASMGLAKDPSLRDGVDAVGEADESTLIPPIK
jgi:hypothetical protein